MIRGAASLAGLVLLAARCCPGQDLAEIELDHSVSSAFVTPHTAWATPYALGKTRVLFFVNGRGANAREVIELKQRFDLDPQMVFWVRVVDTTRDEWHGAETGIRRMAQLLTQPWDAFVFLDVALERVPVEQQYVLIKAVTEGAGLVLVNTDDKRVLKDRNRLSELPAWLGDTDGATAFTVKDGRGVHLAKRPTIEYRRGWEVEYDEWCLRLGKAVLWSARKEPRLTLTLTPAAPELVRASLPGPGAALRWQGAGAQVVAGVTLRRDDGAVISVRQYPLGTPEGSAELEVPKARAGCYFLDVVARDAKAVVSCASVPITVVCPRRVEELKLEPAWAEVGQRLAGEVRLSGEPGAEERLVVSLLDRRGRELVRQPLEPGATAPAFGFSVEPWFPMLLEVRATLLEAGQEVASAWRFARVVKRHRGRFNFVMWDLPGGNLAPYAEESLARSGVTVQLRGGGPPPYVAAFDIAWIPYTIDISSARDAQGVSKPACWWDEPLIQAHVDAVVDRHVPARQHGVLVYSLGDEIAVRGSCLSPHCLAAYRRYLLDQYGDIAALNASWGSSYANFDEVQLGQPEDNDEMQAFRDGNFPRWFDRQAFQSYSFCRLCERFGKGFRRIDPESRCGFEGAGTFSQADDLDGFVRHNTFWSPYPGTADEVLRSIAPRDFPRSNWMGYTKDADSLLEKYWRMVTRGCDSVWWWRWEVMGRFHGWLSPTLDPYPAVQELLRDTAIVRDGLGDLLLDSELQTDGIGLLYSQPSAYAAKVQTSPSYGSYERNHEACHQVLRALGLNFRYFTDRQLRLGEVDLGQFRVIILPLTQALAPPEVERLRQYVRQGGLLIADVRPAIYDGHVKPLAAGQLDDVFGVRRTGSANALLADGQVRVPMPGGASESLALSRVQADAGVQADGAVAAGAAGAAPLVLSHTFGKGRAILLNLALGSFPALGAEPTPELAARLWRSSLEAGQVLPALDLRGPQGRALRDLEVTRWTNGPVQIVSLFRYAGDRQTVALHLPAPMQVYDLKDHRDLGRKRDFVLEVTPHRARFYALAPKPLQPVTLKAAPAVTPGTVQRLRLGSALAQGRQAVRLQVTLPDGRVADWVDAVAIVGKGGAEVAIPVALNDPTGTWTVQATELYTGQTTRSRFGVK